MPATEPFLNEILRDGSRNDWLIVSFLIIAIAYVIIRLIFGRYWRKYRQAVFYSQEAKKLIHEKNVLLLQAAISLNALAAISMGLFLYLFIVSFNLIDSFSSVFAGWMICTLIVIVFVGGKFIAINIMGRSGENINVSTQINHQWLINFKNFGYFLLPFSIASAFIASPFDQIALYLGLVVILFMLIMNYIKGFVILYQHRISIYYGILYLCTLEILPLLIFWRVIGLLMN